jgi:hypothetical protein
MVAKIDDIGLGGKKCAVPATPDASKINLLVVRTTQEYLLGYHGDHT